MRNKTILSFLISILVFCFLGCGPKEESRYVTIENPKLIMDFQNFIEQHRELINKIMIKNGITPTTNISKSDSNPKDWLRYRVTSLKDKETGQVNSSALVWIWGTSKFLSGINLPESIMLIFKRRDNKWYLLLEGGYLSGPRFENEGKTEGLSPEVHVAIKDIFPYHSDLYSVSK